MTMDPAASFIDEKQADSCHIPVMSREVREVLKLGPGMTVVDCTLGLGGHSQMMGEIIGPAGRLVGSR